MMKRRKWAGVDYQGKSREVLLCAECALPLGRLSNEPAAVGVTRTSRDDFGRTYCPNHKHLWGSEKP